MQLKISCVNYAFTKCMHSTMLFGLLSQFIQIFADGSSYVFQPTNYLDWLTYLLAGVLVCFSMFAPCAVGTVRETESKIMYIVSTF